MAKIKKKMSGKKKFGIALCVIPLLLLLADGVMTVYVYNDNFNKRFESYAPLMLSVEDFGGLERIRFQFPSDKGQMLTGYLYTAGEEQKGVIVMAHGFGGSSQSAAITSSPMTRPATTRAKEKAWAACRRESPTSTGRYPSWSTVLK